MKNRKLKPWVYNALFIICGGALGQVLAALCSNVPALSWLSYKVNIGLTEPFVINLIVAKITGGFYFVICPALIIFTVLALAVGNICLLKSKAPEKKKIFDLENQDTEAEIEDTYDDSEDSQ